MSRKSNVSLRYGLPSGQLYVSYKARPASLSLPPPCRGQVMVAEALDISRETYFAILMDRSCNGPVMVGSPQGGMDIEEVAATNPELIFKVRRTRRQSLMLKTLIRHEAAVYLFDSGMMCSSVATEHFEINKLQMFTPSVCVVCWT